MNILPKNRHMLIEMSAAQEESPSSILVPDDYVSKQSNEYELVKVLALAPDCSTSLHGALGRRALVEGHMIKDVTIAGAEYKLVLENYMLAVLDDSQ
jgi:co-chaperonin GroES (HSP10)|tara:strand:+ start:515 stop:805 length:291 start_codon:yes stop_codon:yes gene_type:complete